MHKIVKIFVSYSRTDAGHFAEKIHKDLTKKGHDVFIDVNNIKIGDIWNNTIEDNISKSDLFVVLISPESLKSEYIEKEVLQAQKENKRIIPCLYKYIKKDEIKWNLNRYQGIEFENIFDLALNLYRKIDDEIRKQTKTKFSKPVIVGIAGISVLIVITFSTIFLGIFNQSDYSFSKAWGTEGIGNGQFNSPAGIDVDSSGFVYVADTDNHRIQKFDSNGNFITKWGSKGTGEGQLFLPEDISVDSSGFVYVADTFNHRIQKFDSNGNFITKWGSFGSDAGQFNYPQGIAIDSNGVVYVADTENHRIQKFDSNGNFITKWGSKGTGEGQLFFPNNIDVDLAGNLYEGDGAILQKFDSNGNFITKWGAYGTGNGQFNSPEGIAVDSSGFVYVADTSNYRIQKFDSSGNFITKWGAYGTGNGQFEQPMSLDVNSSGYIYVVDSRKQQTLVFESKL